MKRLVEPEWLDELPADDHRAVESRRDLRRLNWIMGHAGVFVELLRAGAHRPAPLRIVELGAGDGTLMLRLAQCLSRFWKRVEVLLVDRSHAVTRQTRAGFEALGWKVEVIAEDVFEFLEKPSARRIDVMLTNLFLHHFSQEQLARILELAAQRTKIFAAVEPRRAKMPLAFSRMVGLIGCNEVTRRDAVASVRAGFAGRELSALWPATKQWSLREGRAQLFSHQFLAERTNIA